MNEYTHVTYLVEDVLMSVGTALLIEEREAAAAGSNKEPIQKPWEDRYSRVSKRNRGQKPRYKDHR